MFIILQVYLITVGWHKFEPWTHYPQKEWYAMGSFFCLRQTKYVKLLNANATVFELSNNKANQDHWSNCDPSWSYTQKLLLILDFLSPKLDTNDHLTIAKDSISWCFGPHSCFNQVISPFPANSNHSKRCFRKMQFWAIFRQFFALHFEKIR